MYKRLRSPYAILTALMALLGSTVLLNVAKSEDPKAHAADVQAIKKAGAAYTAAFEKGDIEGLLSHWATDADYIDESGKMIQGREAIAAHIRKGHENLKGYKMKLESSGVRFVTPDVALVEGKGTLISPEGDEDVTPFTAVWVKRGGQWLVRSLRDLGDSGEQKPVTHADHLKPLEKFLGDWVSSNKDVQVDLHCDWTLNKSFILMEFKIKKGDKESLTAQRFGWDPINQQIRSWYFDSTGGYGEATWTEEEDGYVGEAGGVLQYGRVGTATYYIRPGEDGSFVYQARNRTVDGRPLADFDDHFVRKAGKG
jgi:uncharacterized protein (TIGR02246 family)